MYIDIFLRLRDTVRRKRSEKWKTKIWHLLHDSAPAHRSVLVKYLLTKYRVILSVLDPRECEYPKDYSLDFEHAYMTTYLAS